MKTENGTTYKTTTTARPYTVETKGYAFTLLPGWPVSNNTACGPDDSYHFAMNTGPLARQLTGFKDSILAHDWRYYGLNIPAEFCHPYKAA